MIAENKVNEVINDLTLHFKNMARNGQTKECRIYNYIQLAECYLLQGKDNKALKVLYETFLLSEPRPTVCYKIASIYFDQGEYERAQYWIELAVNTDMKKAK